MSAVDSPERTADGLPDAESLKKVFTLVTAMVRSGRAKAVRTPGFGGIAEAVMKMSFGNGFGFSFADGLTIQKLFGYDYGAFLIEVEKPEDGEEVIGFVTAEEAFCLGGERIPAGELLRRSEEKLESIFACNIPMEEEEIPAFSFREENRPAPHILSARPKILIPAFPGTNCEYDSAKAAADAGAEPEILVIGNLTADAVARSVERFAEAADRKSVV